MRQSSSLMTNIRELLSVVFTGSSAPCFDLSRGQNQSFLKKAFTHWCYWKYRADGSAKCGTTSVNEARAPVALQSPSPVGYSGGFLSSLTFLPSRWSQGCWQDAATTTNVTLMFRVITVLNRDKAALTDVDVSLWHVLIHQQMSFNMQLNLHVQNTHAIESICPAGYFLNPFADRCAYITMNSYLTSDVWPTLISGCGKRTNGCIYKVSGCTIGSVWLISLFSSVATAGCYSTGDLL